MGAQKNPDLWPGWWMEKEKPLPPILQERLRPGWSSADLWERMDALFEHYGLSRESDDWHVLVWYLAIDYIRAFQEAKPAGRPRKRDFTDRDAIIYYELGDAEYKKNWKDSPLSVNARARIVGKRLGEANPVKIKNRYHTLHRRNTETRFAMFTRGAQLARTRKSGAKIQS